MARRRPGWYTDPANRAPVRWWDGTAWTAWLADGDDGFPPPGEIARVTPDGMVLRTMAVRLALLAAVALVILGILAALGMRHRDDLLPAPRAPRLSSFGSPQVVPDRYAVLDYEATTRSFRIGTLLRGQLPGMPFKAGVDVPMPAIVSEGAWVYADQAGWVRTKNWPPLVLAGVADPNVLTDSSERVLGIYVDAIRSGFYSEVDTTDVTEQVTKPEAGLAPHPAVHVEQQISYRLSAGEPERTDTLSVRLVKLTPDITFVWIEVRPQGTPDTVIAQMEAYRRAMKTG